MKVLVKIVFAIVLLILVSGSALYFIAPGELNVSLSTQVFSPKKLVFDHVNDLRKWPLWSPWAEMDSSMEISYGETSQGLGGYYKWKGDPSLSGEGTMTIVMSEPSDSILLDLHFITYNSNSKVKWTFANTDKGFTYVTWSMHEDLSNPINRIMTYLMVDTTEMINQFQRGLAKMRDVCEHKAHYNTSEPEIINVQPLPVISVNKTCSYGQIESAMSDGLKTLMSFLKKNMKTPDGPPMCIWKEMSDPRQFNFDIAIPVEGELESTELVTSQTLNGTKAVSVNHHGHYELITSSYEKLYDYMEKEGHEASGPSWDIYITSPFENEDPNTWVTKIIIPIK